jgi:hypothetical protein
MQFWDALLEVEMPKSPDMRRQHEKTQTTNTKIPNNQITRNESYWLISYPYMLGDNECPL